MPEKRKLVHLLFRGEVFLTLLLLALFVLGRNLADAVVINTIDDSSQWVSSNSSVLPVEGDTVVKQEGTGSVKLTATQGEATWYDTSYGNRKPVTITHSGSELTNADTLVEIDTASLVSGGKLQTDCDDLRFTDSDGTTAISYWIESGCNTSTTQVWVEVPSIPDGGKTIYFYYNNDSATNGEASWSGNFILMHDSTCPSGWTQVSELDSKFPYGSSSWGTTGGSNNNSHAQVSCTASTAQPGAGEPGSGIISHAAKNHSHTGVKVDVNSASNLPSYLDMVYCKKDESTVPSGMIALFDASAPSGWTRFSALDSKFPRGNTSYGGTGGSTSHSHSTSGGYGTGGSGTTTSRDAYPGESSCGNHSHTSSSGTTASATHTPPYLDMVFAEADSQVVPPAGTITMSTATPPLGWTRFSALDSKLPRGASSYGGTGGSTTHSHSVTINTSENCNFVGNIYNSGNNGSSSHAMTCSTSTNSQSNLPSYVETIFVKRSSTAASTSVGSEQQNGANNHTATDTITATDLSSHSDISFYVRSDRTGTFTRFEMGESSSSEQTYSITINSANTWELKTWDISGITGTSRDAITKMAFRVTDASTGFTFNFDNLRANSAPSTPTVSTPADDTWTSSRQFCSTTTDPDGDSWNATYVLSGVGSYDGEIVASGASSCYTHTTDLSSVSWHANATDSNGYVSSNTASYTAKIDSVAPTGLSASNSSSSWVTDKPTVTVSTPTDATAGVQEIRYAWDTNDLTSNCTGGTLTSSGADLTSTLTQGSHVLYLCVKDNAGNVSSWDGAYKWDNGNPVVNITSHISTTYNASDIPSAISGTASDVASAVSSVAVTIYDGAMYWSGTAWDSVTRVWHTATGTTSFTFSFTPNKDGSFTLEGRSTDSAGNTSTLDSVSFSYDSVAPGVSVDPSVSVTDTTATITWETDDDASTRVQYGPSTSYGNFSTESDLSPRVTSHTDTLSNLRSCTKYYYRVRGTDAAGNQVTGTQRTFTTTGCVGSSTITSETESEVTTSGGSVELQDGSERVTLTVPPSFSSTTATFQVKKLDKVLVLAAVSKPTSTLNAVGNHVYKMDALEDAETVVSTFDSAVTVTMEYTNTDIAGLDESSLVIYRHDGTSWYALDDCTVDTAANTVTCTTSSFSTFILFGSDAPSTGQAAPVSSDNGVCEGPPPGAKAPWLYGAIPQSPTSMKLYFTDGDEPIEKYVLSYGQESGVYTYGSDNIGWLGDGYRQYTVSNLQPGTKYFFRVRGENRCEPGPWSNEFSSSTPTSYRGTPASINEVDLSSQSFVDSIEVKPIGDVAATCRSYTVKEGDTLWGISQAEFGDPWKYTDIIERNKDMHPSLVTDPSYIEIGWVLNIDCSRSLTSDFSVSLKLIDNNGRGVRGARVVMSGKESTTGDDGRAQFSEVSSGVHTISIYNDRELVAEREVSIEPGAATYEVLVRVKSSLPWKWYFPALRWIQGLWLRVSGL